MGWGEGVKGSEQRLFLSLMVPEGGDPNSAILVMAAEHVRQRHSTGSCIPSEPNTGIRQSPKKPEVQKIFFLQIILLKARMKPLQLNLSFHSSLSSCDAN